MNFDYNTQRAKMALPEYGRNVQKMIEHVKTIKDRDMRNRAARTVIQVMGNLNPHLRDQGDFKHKLWDHLALISRFELDIDSPYPTPEPSHFTEKPASIPYLQGTIKSPHYGRIAQNMIREIMKMEEGNERKFLTIMVLNHMKKSYVLWNKSSVADEVIIKDFRELSHERVDVPEGIKLIDVKEPQQLQQQQGGKRKPQKIHAGSANNRQKKKQPFNKPQQKQKKRPQGKY